MSLAYLFDSNIQFQDKSGNNNVNGFLRVYIDNTDDRAVTYKDFNGTLNQADIRLDNNGRAVVIVDDSKTYRLEVYGTTGVLLWTLYPISPKATGINETLEALVAAVKSHTIAIEGLSLGKKNKQQAKVISGTTTQTVKSLSQNADGEITVEFEDIAFPHKVLVDGKDSEPKYLEDAVKADENGLLRVRVDENEDSTPEHPDKVLVIDDSELRDEIDSNAQRIENIEEAIADMNMDSVPHAYLHSTLNQSAGDSVTTGTQINVFALTADLVGDCFEFEQTTTIDDTPFGYVWIEPGTYLINASVTLQWVGNPRGTFVAKVGSVMGENFDFSQEQEIKRNTTKVVTIPNRMKLSVNITYDAGTPVMGFWIQSMQVVKLAGGMSQTNVAHDSTLTGKGSVAEPLGVTTDVFGKVKNIPTSISQFRNGDVIPVDGPEGTVKMPASELQDAILGGPVDEAVQAWLDEHPEATTTVQDGAISERKLNENLLDFIKRGYYVVTPSTLSDALTKGFKTLYLKDGDYVFDSIILSPGSNWIGESKNAHLKGNLSLSNDCVLNNLTIGVAGKEFGASNSFGESRNNIIVNCVITGGGTSVAAAGGFYCNDTNFSYTEFKDCEFCYCISNGVKLVHKTNGKIHHIKFENCYFHDNGTMNFEVFTGVQDVSRTDGYSHVDLINCMFDGASFGGNIGISCSFDGANSHDCRIVGCTFTASNVYTFEVAGPYNIYVDNCKIDGAVSCSRRQNVYCGLSICNSRLYRGILVGNNITLCNNEIRHSLVLAYSDRSVVQGNHFDYDATITSVQNPIRQLVFENSSYCNILNNLFEDHLESGPANANIPLRIYYAASVYNVIMCNTFISNFVNVICAFGSSDNGTLSDSDKQIFNTNTFNEYTFDWISTNIKQSSRYFTSTTFAFSIVPPQNKNGGLLNSQYEVCVAGRYNNSTVAGRYIITFSSYNYPTATPIIYTVGESPALTSTFAGDGTCRFSGSVNISSIDVLIRKIL
jgi:hypothetical protein